MISRVDRRTASSLESRGSQPSADSFSIESRIFGTSPVQPRSPPVYSRSGSAPSSSATMVAIRSTEVVVRAQIVRIHGVVGVFDGVTDRVETVLEMEVGLLLSAVAENRQVLGVVL